MLNNSEITPIDFPKLKEWLNLSNSAVLDAKGKNIVLVVGNTGSGKSTFINYLLGSKLKKVKKGMTSIVELEEGEREYAKIGTKQLGSQTLVPQVITSPLTVGYALCDCPGFNGTRGKEEQLTTLISNTLVTTMAEQVRALIIIIDKSAFTTIKAEGFRQMLTLVNNVLVNPKLYTRSIYFGITKTNEDDSKEDFIQTLKLMANELSEEIKITSKPETNKEIKQRLDIINLMLRKLENIFLINPFDEGRCRDELLNRLRVTLPIPKDQLAFMDTEKNGIEFHQFVRSIVQDGTKAISIYLKACDSIKNLKNMIGDNSKTIKEKHVKISEIKRDIANVSPADPPSRSKKLNEVIDRLKFEINTHDENIKKAELQIITENNQCSIVQAHLETNKEFYQLLKYIIKVFPYIQDQSVNDFFRNYSQLSLQQKDEKSYTSFFASPVKMPSKDTQIIFSEINKYNV